MYNDIPNHLSNFIIENENHTTNRYINYKSKVLRNVYIQRFYSTHKNRRQLKVPFHNKQLRT